MLICRDIAYVFLQQFHLRTEDIELFFSFLLHLLFTQPVKLSVVPKNEQSFMNLQKFHLLLFT